MFHGEMFHVVFMRFLGWFCIFRGGFVGFMQEFVHKCFKGGEEETL